MSDMSAFEMQYYATGRKRKRMRSSGTVALSKLFDKAGNLVAFFVHVIIPLLFKYKIDIFHIVERRILIVRLCVSVFRTWKICFPPHSANLVKKTN